MSVIGRMVRLGVVADRRLAPGELRVIPPAVAGARLGPIWMTGHLPTGPLSPDQRTALTEASRTSEVVLLDEDAYPVWGPGYPLSPGLAAPERERRPRVVIAAWPERSLDGLLATWLAAGGIAADLIVEVPVSIGRTRAEAAARSGDWFAALGDPSGHGLFGTLEDCQDQIAALAEQGVTELSCVLPRADPIDVIAQLSAVGIGLLRARGPGVARSAAPAPPQGWGSRSRQ
jgi:hypothetical protein